MESSMRHAIVDTAVGTVALVAEANALVGVYAGTSAAGAARFGVEVPLDADAVLEPAGKQVVEFFSSLRSTFDLTAEAHGSIFQERIWAMIEAVPFGETTTLEKLASMYAARYLAKDIADAINCNPLSVIVPTHRVVGRCGNIGGFSGGLPLKRTLLEIEGNRWITQSQRSDLRYLTLERTTMAAHVA